MLPQTLEAIEKARQSIRFGDVLFVCDRPAEMPSGQGVRVAKVDALRSREDYSEVVQTQLADLVETSFVMIVQWDGYPTRPANWTDEFLDYDYIGAVWPQFSTDMAVGNGGFSLRSRKLLQACTDPRFKPGHPEDVVICHANRPLLEQYGIKFAPPELARRFSYERERKSEKALGFHGLFNMPDEMGIDNFLKFFARVDHRHIGVRELCDLREVLRMEGSDAARKDAGKIMRGLMRTHWRDPALRRYVWRALTRSDISPWVG